MFLRKLQLDTDLYNPVQLLTTMFHHKSIKLPYKAQT